MAPATWALRRERNNATASDGFINAAYTALAAPLAVNARAQRFAFWWHNARRRATPRPPIAPYIVRKPVAQAGVAVAARHRHSPRPAALQPHSRASRDLPTARTLCARAATRAKALKRQARRADFADATLRSAGKQACEEGSCAQHSRSGLWQTALLTCLSHQAACRRTQRKTATGRACNL